VLAGQPWPSNIRPTPSRNSCNLKPQEIQPRRRHRLRHRKQRWAGGAAALHGAFLEAEAIGHPLIEESRVVRNSCPHWRCRAPPARACWWSAVRTCRARARCCEPWE